MKIQFFRVKIIPEEVFEIYECSFPENEKKPINDLVSNINSDKESLIIAKIDSEIVGFALIFNLENSEWSLLDYLAVSESKRGLGVGKSLLRFVKKDLKRKSRSLVIELDKPLGKDQVYDNKCLHRINFYEQCGASIINGLEYILPSLNNSEKTLQFLMIIPYKRKKELNGRELKNLLNELYQQNYSEYYQQTDLDSMIASIDNIFI